MKRRTEYFSIYDLFDISLIMRQQVGGGILS